MDHLFISMLKRQIRLNTQVSGIGWATTEYPWHTALWVECAELMETTDWKWWKDTKFKEEKFKAELMDIWHFGMSMLAIEFGISNTQDERALKLLASYLSRQYETITQGVVDGARIKDNIERIAETAFYRRFDSDSFMLVMHHAGINFGDFYIRYLAKATLNEFRINNGYQTGQYRWNTDQDNQNLNEIISLFELTTGYKVLGLGVSECWVEAFILGHLTLRYQEPSCTCVEKGGHPDYCPVHAT